MTVKMRFSRLYATTLAVTVLLINRASSSSAGGDELGLESGIRILYNNYRQCENESPQMVTCLKLKALRLADRALTINNIPIIEGISITKKEEGQRSLDEKPTTTLDESSLPSDPVERSRQIDYLLWDRISRFMESRSLQMKVNQLFSNDNSELDASGEGRKKDKNKGMYMYMMMMKGGMLALAYKGLALLAGKALLVSKIALTLALLVAVKKLFSHGGSAKTTYEIVKTPIITHSHQYSGANGGAATHGHYGAADFSSYDGGPYARSLDMMEAAASGGNYKNNAGPPAVVMDPHAPTYVTTHIVETVEGRAAQGRSLSGYNLSQQTDPSLGSGGKKDQDDGVFEITGENYSNNKYNIPYAHLAAYRSQLNVGNSADDITTILSTVASAAQV